MKKKVISSDKAPSAIGPYSQAIVVDGIIYTSGQIPTDPLTGSVVSGGIDAQTRQVLNNLREVLNTAGSDFESVVKTTIFIKDMNDFSIINNIYGEHFKKPFPARSCIEVTRLPKDVLIEIEAMAVYQD